MSVTGQINKLKERVIHLEYLINKCFNIRENGMLTIDSQNMYKYKSQIEEIKNGYK